jgi:hypothetical protein
MRPRAAADALAILEGLRGEFDQSALDPALVETWARNGLRVVRVQARSREAVASTVEHLTLHYQVRHLDTPERAELHKLQLLKDELGELSQQDEKKFNSLKRAAERPIGYVDSAVMLNAKLRPGATLLHVVAMTRALGEQLSPKDVQPEVFRWTDGSQSHVTCEFLGGKLRTWRLERPAAEEPSA